MEGNFGGKTGDLIAPEMAGNLNAAEKTVAIETPKDVNTEKNLGAMAAYSAGAAEVAMPKSEDTLSFAGVDMETGMKETPELKPLVADGSTEGRLGKAAVSLVHEDINLGIVREAEKSSEEFKNNPSKLDDKRNELMVKMLRDEFGRIFADDGNENDGIDQGGITEDYGKQGGSMAA